VRHWTEKGRIVYDRKPKYFGAKDIRRILRKLEASDIDDCIVWKEVLDLTVWLWNHSECGDETNYKLEEDNASSDDTVVESDDSEDEESEDDEEFEFGGGEFGGGGADR